MSDLEHIQRLIRLKRHERPSDGFVEHFVSTFQERQRSELLRHSARGLLWERVTTYMEGLLNPRWAWAGATAVAVVGLGFMLRPTGSGNVQMAANKSGASTTISSHYLQPVSLNASLEAQRERAALNADIEQYLISHHYGGGFGDEQIFNREVHPNGLNPSQVYPNGFYVDLIESGVRR